VRGGSQVFDRDAHVVEPALAPEERRGREASASIGGRSIGARCRARTVASERHREADDGDEGMRAAHDALRSAPL
jgi:hypothetical protein